MMSVAAPVVSVLLPVFNGAATVARAIESMRAQTFTDWELLVVDDGSTDDTRATMGALCEKDPRIRLIVRPHEGIVAALNAGLAQARGEFVARMDADDESLPQRVAHQVAFLHSPENSRVGLVSCLVEFGGDRVVSEGYARHVDWINSLVTPEQIALNRFVESPFAHPSVMFRRALIDKLGGYRSGDFPEDYELWLRWLEAGVTMAKVPEVLLRWNDPPTRLSRVDSRYDPDAFFRAKAPYIAQWLAAAGFVRTRKILVWGAGRWTRKRAALLAVHGVTIAGYVDVDWKKASPALGGHGVPVLLPDELPPPGDCFVLGYVSKRGAREWIHEQLRARGYEEGRDFLMCA